MCGQVCLTLFQFGSAVAVCPWQFFWQFRCSLTSVGHRIQTAVFAPSDLVPAVCLTKLFFEFPIPFWQCTFSLTCAVQVCLTLFQSGSAVAVCPCTLFCGTANAVGQVVYALSALVPAVSQCMFYLTLLQSGSAKAHCFSNFLFLLTVHIQSNHAVFVCQSSLCVAVCVRKHSLAVQMQSHICSLRFC